MTKVQEKRISNLKGVIIPDLVKRGKFRRSSDGLKILKVDTQDSIYGSGHWASSTLFVDLHLTDDSKEKFIKKIVVKYPPLDELLVERMKSHLLFKNESVVYKEVIPKYIEFLTEQAKKLNDESILKLTKDLFPTCYFTEFNPAEPENAIVVLDDLRQHGYKLSSHRTNMDIQHVNMALEQIARFHAIGYAFKITKPEEYKNLISKISLSKYDRNIPDNDDFQFTLSVQACRAIERLLENGGEGINVDDLMKLKNAFEKVWYIMCDAVEPNSLSVLNHGDFCGNNVFFHYDEKSNVDGAVLFDFQTPVYSSPAIDLSFFICVSTDEDFRNQHFKEMLIHYHSKMIATLEKIIGRPVEEPEFSFEEFRKDFAEHAVYGYTISSFFTPVMLNICKEPFDLKEDLRKAVTMSREERKKDLLQIGGERGTLANVKLFKEYYSRGFFQHFLNSTNL